jgi:hypothetical protein
LGSITSGRPAANKRLVAAPEHADWANRGLS